MIKGKKQRALSLQLCLFSDAEMQAMAEPMPEIVVPIDPLPRLFILPYLKGKSFRQERAGLLSKRRKKAIAKPAGLSPGLTVNILLFDTASKPALVT